MNTDFTSVGKGSFLAALASISDKGLTRIEPEISDQLIDFSEILSDQDAFSGIIDQLRELLPEQAYTQLETLLESGNDLPQAASVTGNQQIESDPISIDSLFSTLGLTPVSQPASVEKPPVAIIPKEGKTITDIGTLVAAGSAVIRNTLNPQSVEGQQGTRVNPPLPGVENAIQAYNPAPAPALTPALTPALAPASAPASAPVGGLELLQVRNETVGWQPLPAAVETTVTARGSFLPEVAEESFAPLIAGPRFLPSEAQLRTLIPISADLTQPVGEKGWDRGLGDRILWMVGRSIQNASLHVTPPRLGPVEIQVSMHQDQASVSFTTHNNVVKEALEAAIPRLREMFSDSNLQLVNVDVGQREASGQRAPADGFTGKQAGSGDGQDPAVDRQESEAEETPSSDSIRDIISSGLLDDYA